MVWLCQQDAALEKANTMQGCIRQGVFSADLTLVQGAAGISPEETVPDSYSSKERLNLRREGRVAAGLLKLSL